MSAIVGFEKAYQRLNSYKPHRSIEPVEVKRYFISNASIEIRSECVGLIERLDEFFLLQSAFSSPVETYVIDVFEDRDQFPIVFNGRTLDTGLNLGDTAVKVLREVNTVVTENIARVIYMHAACVAHGEGAVLFPAVGGVGKTTLAAYLIAHGWKHLNDDVVLLTEDSLQLLPVTVALSIKRGSWPLLESSYPELTGLRIQLSNQKEFKYLPPKSDQVAVDAVDCCAVVLPRYSAACTKPAIELASPIESFIAIFEGGGMMQRPLEPTRLSAFVNWLDQIPCYKLHYNHLHDARSLLEELF